VDISKSAIVTMGFSIEDKHFIKWLWVKSVEQSTFSRCFLTKDEGRMGKTLSIKLLQDL